MSDLEAPITPKTDLPEPTHRFLDQLREWAVQCFKNVTNRLDNIDQSLAALNEAEDTEDFPVGTILTLVPNPTSPIVLGPGGEDTITLSGGELHLFFYLTSGGPIIDTQPIGVGTWISIGTPTSDVSILNHGATSARIAINFRRIS